MPPSGYENKTTIEETDFNGIAGFIINCERFKGKITGGICETAREVVNHIRHMPDMCSSTLTDKATSDCIDNLYALLNEPGLKNRSEAIEARDQLDELKTADLSKDENANKYICKELHDEFQQKIADIETKLQTSEINAESAKTYLHIESKRVLEGLEHFSDDAMQDLSRTKNDILSTIKEEERRVTDHITLMERKATERISQSIEEGSKSLEEKVKILADKMRTEKDESLQRKKQELKRQIIEHYKLSSSHIAVRLDIDETIENTYENPKLTFKKIKNVTPTGEAIPEVSELFSTSDDPMAKIIVEGDAGTGKTSLCKKIVHDWLKVNENVEKPVASNLSKFEFVFFIILREVKTESEIKNMIVQHILKKIDSDYENEHSLLGEILKREHCLLLLDGLDEWRGKMPHVETSWKNCTTLITTRPYKLAELKLSPTQVDKLVKLEGVKNPKELVLRVIRKLEEIHKTNRDPKSCKQDLKDIHLWHFSDYPVVLVHIVWLWHKNKLRNNMSCSTLYQEIFDERWYDMCDKKEPHTDRQELFDVLSEIAFNKLLSENEDESLVFNIKGIQLEKFKQYREVSLESGIISSSNVPGERFPQYQFLHKTFQEYLVAVFLSKRGPALSTCCEHVKNIYWNHRNESIFALEKVFLFLCGLNPVAAKEFSKTLNELFIEKYERGDEANISYRRRDPLTLFQEMILNGHDEAERNGHIGAEFCLQHIRLGGSLNTPNTKLKLYLDKRKSNLVTLIVMRESEELFALHNIDDPTILDLQICKNLKTIILNDQPYEDINQLNLNGLSYCDIQFRDYKPAKRLISSLQTHDLGGLRHLTLKNVGFECEAMNIFSRLKCIKELDLTWSKASRQNDSPFDFEHLRHLDYLIKLRFEELPFFDVVNIQLCNLHGLSIGFRTQQQAPLLIAALLQKNDHSLTTFPNGQHLIPRNLSLRNVCVSSEVLKRLVCVGIQSALQMVPRQVAYIRLEDTTVSADVVKHLVNLVLKSGYSVRIDLRESTIEEDVMQNKIENQPTILLSTEPSTDFPTYIIIDDTTLSAQVFKHLVRVVLQGYYVTFMLNRCTIEENITQVQEEIGNQTALQVMVPQAASTNYITDITYDNKTVSAEIYRSLVSVVLQSGHSVMLKFDGCTIENDIMQVQEETGNPPAFHMVAPQDASTDNKKYITLFNTTVSADVVKRLISLLLKAGHNVDLELDECTIEEDITLVQEEMGNQPALHVVAPQDASTDYTTHIELNNTTVSAELFRCLVTSMLQSGHSVDVELDECTIEEDITQVQKEMGNQPTLQVVAPQAASTDYTTHIKLNNTTVSAELFRCLATSMLQSGHSVDVELVECTIKEDITQVQEEMGNQPTLQVVAPQAASTDYTTHIELNNTTVSAELFRCLVTSMLQSGHSVNLELDECTIEEDIPQVQEEMGSQSALQVVAPQAASTDYTTHIEIKNTTVSAESLRCLITSMLQSGHSVDVELDECTIKEDITQVQEKMGNQPTLQVVAPQAASTDYTTHIELNNTTVSAELFRCLVTSMLQSGHSVDVELVECTIEEDIPQVQENMGNQSALQVVAPQAASNDYEINIKLNNTTVSAGVVKRLVSFVLESGNSVKLELDGCTIWEDITQVQEKMGNRSALQVMTPQPASTDLTTNITLTNTTVSADVFRRLVSVVLQSGHSVQFTLDYCVLEEDITQVQEEMGNHPALQVLAPQPASTDFTTNITLVGMTVSAEGFRRLLSVVIHSGHNVGCQLESCTIKPDDKMIMLQAEMENQPAIQVIEFSRGEDGWYITYIHNV